MNDTTQSTRRPDSAGAVDPARSSSTSPPKRAEGERPGEGPTAVAQLARALQLARSAIASGNIDSIVSAEARLNRLYPWADRAMRSGESGLSDDMRSAFRGHIREVRRDLWDAHDRAIAEAVPNELTAAAEAKARTR